MHLAINYSPQAAGLVKLGQIDIDYFKVPDWDGMIAEATQLRPVMVHFTLTTGNDFLGEENWDNVTRLAQATSTPFINLHLDARQEYYPDLSVDTLQAPDVDRVYRIIFSEVNAVVNRFSAGRVIIENSPYQANPGNTLRMCVEPDLIKRLVHETGCGFLLDISHAIIAARTLGMQPDEYISRLPVDCVKEMHFAGIHWLQATSCWMDHLSIQPGDWQWLDWVLKQIKDGMWPAPWLLAFEYGGVGEPFEWRSNPEVMAEQVPQLQAHLAILDG